MGDLQKALIVFGALWVLIFPYIALIIYLNYGQDIMIGLAMGWGIATIVVGVIVGSEWGELA